MKWTREELETHPGTTGEVYRQLLEHGKPARMSQFYEGEEWHRARSAASRLEDHGWAKRHSKVLKEWTYEALHEQLPGYAQHVEGPPPSVIRNKRLAKLMKVAAKARKSALAVEMAAALLDIENELRAVIRGGLGNGGV